MKIWIILTILIVSFKISISYASFQATEKILFNGKTYDLLNYPLERYFGIHKDKKPKIYSRSTGLARGYIGHYKFKDESLVLKDIISYKRKITQGTFNPFESRFKNLVSSGKPLELNWYSGILHLAYEEDKSANVGFKRSYNHHILIAIKNGKFNGFRKFTKNEIESFNKKRYELYKKSNYYKKKSVILIKEGKTTEEVDRYFLYNILPRIGEFLDKQS